jgi:hypothetical protein
MNITRLNTLNDDKVIIKKEGSNGGNYGDNSGGDNSGGGSGSDWHYFDISGCDMPTKVGVLGMAMLQKVQGKQINSFFGTGVVQPMGLLLTTPVDVAEVTAVAIDYAIETRIGEQASTLGESFTNTPFYGTFPEITKEEFYNLKA